MMTTPAGPPGFGSTFACLAGPRLRAGSGRSNGWRTRTSARLGLTTVLILCTLGCAKTDPASIANLRSPASERRVAITFDDLPGVAMPDETRCDEAALQGSSKRLLAPFVAADAPVAAFVTPGRLCDSLPEAVLDELLNLWIESGAVLGNHTYSHLDLNRVTVSEFLEDIERGASAIERALQTTDQADRFFRFPYLHSGDTQEKRDSVRKWLRDEGYKDGVVTMDNQEWVYSEVYARALERGDEAVAQRTVDEYLVHLEESLSFYEELSMDRFEREIPQVLLLHVNSLNADHIDRVLGLLTDRGYRLIRLQEALRDDAYALADRYVGPRGLSWIFRWMPEAEEIAEAEPRESVWVREQFEEYRRTSSSNES